MKSESENESLLELDIDSDGAIRPFMFEPQHGSSSEDDDDHTDAQPETEESQELSTQSRLGTREWCLCGNCQVMVTEQESICCQEMDVLGDRLDLEDRNETFKITAYSD